MICNFLVTLTLMITGPTKKNNQGIIKVEQYGYSKFINATRHAKESLLSMSYKLAVKEYPAIVGVEIIKTENFNCNYDGEQQLKKRKRPGL